MWSLKRKRENKNQMGRNEIGSSPTTQAQKSNMGSNFLLAIPISHAYILNIYELAETLIYRRMVQHERTSRCHHPNYHFYTTNGDSNSLVSFVCFFL